MKAHISLAWVSHEWDCSSATKERSKYLKLLDYLVVLYLLYFNINLVVPILYEYVIDNNFVNNNICEVIKESAIQSYFSCSIDTRNSANELKNWRMELKTLQIWPKNWPREWKIVNGGNCEIIGIWDLAWSILRNDNSKSVEKGSTKVTHRTSSFSIYFFSFLCDWRDAWRWVQLQY